MKLGGPSAGVSASLCESLEAAEAHQLPPRGRSLLSDTCNLLYGT
jgi:hypothetical protein